MCKDVLNRISGFPSALQYQSGVAPVDQSNQLTTLQVLVSKATAQVDRYSEELCSFKIKTSLQLFHIKTICIINYLCRSG